jgi:hypothetical protein
MELVLGIVFGGLAIGRAIYPTPIRWRIRPWFVKTDKQGRMTLAAWGCGVLLIAVGHAVT